MQKIALVIVTVIFALYCSSLSLVFGGFDGFAEFTLVILLAYMVITIFVESPFHRNVAQYFLFAVTLSFVLYALSGMVYGILLGLLPQTVLNLHSLINDLPSFSAFIQTLIVLQSAIAGIIVFVFQISGTFLSKIRKQINQERDMYDKSLLSMYSMSKIILLMMPIFILLGGAASALLSLSAVKSNVEDAVYYADLATKYTMGGMIIGVLSIFGYALYTAGIFAFVRKLCHECLIKLRRTINRA